MHCYRCS